MLDSMDALVLGPAIAGCFALSLLTGKLALRVFVNRILRERVR